ncbi:aminopeptidase P family protein [Muribaculum intestinale]|uniref:aminopeptidase P family protein n=2 Tax=Muribaculum intestinale TaxID=1796646 RepID=UPI0025B6EDAC|nr:aminopeptidase P family protein [Muribaculum intestinale]
MDYQIIKSRLESLRTLMRKSGISAAVIPHVDPHQSEYMSSHWHVREFFSGFNGSAGTLVVTLDGAALWTDSRYFLQAASQLENTTIELMKDGLPSTPTISSYIINVLHAGDTVGVDGMLFTKRSLDSLEGEFSGASISVKPDFRPADILWTDRPPLPSDPIYILPEQYAGEMSGSKIQRLREAVNGSGAEAVYITELDSIAWLLNLRGSDVDFNPVFTSTLYIGPNSGVLFIDAAKVPDDVRTYLAGYRIDVMPYDSATAYLSGSSLPVLANPATLPAALARTPGINWIYAPSPVPAMKAEKNDVELRNLRHAMVIEGASMVNAIYHITERLNRGETVTELDVVDTLSHCRAAHASYRGDSFGTIAGYGAHGAIVHYEPTPESNATLRPEGLLLVDTGGQYLYGTTDITRTISLGNPTDDERHDFTLVLKGHIALARAVFPEGTRGAQLDVLARQYLWQEGKTYLHGTGHGVGFFLNVHEGPQSIRLQENPVALRPGMVTSDEPGLYLSDRYGIRCENLVLTVGAGDTEHGRFLKFEVLSLFPFDRNLLDFSILTDDEIMWLNDYHRKVWSELADYLQGAPLRWLEQACAPISR